MRSLLKFDHCAYYSVLWLFRASRRCFGNSLEIVKCYTTTRTQLHMLNTSDIESKVGKGEILAGGHGKVPVRHWMQLVASRREGNSSSWKKMSTSSAHHVCGQAQSLMKLHFFLNLHLTISSWAYGSSRCEHFQEPASPNNQEKFPSAMVTAETETQEKEGDV